LAKMATLGGASFYIVIFKGDSYASSLIVGWMDVRTHGKGEH